MYLRKFRYEENVILCRGESKTGIVLKACIAGFSVRFGIKEGNYGRYVFVSYIYDMTPLADSMM